MTFIGFKLERSGVHLHFITVYNLISRRRPLFIVFFFCLLWVSKVQFSSFVKGGAFSNRERNLFHARNFKNGPLKPGNFFVMTLKTLPSEFHLRIYWFADRSFYKLSSVMLQTFIKVSDYCFSICTHFDWTLSKKIMFFWKQEPGTLFCYNFGKLWL